MRLRAGAALRLLAAAGLLVSTTSHGERLPVQRHGVAEGLAEETVTALLRDSRGYLWAGSLNGLSRFDGERFKVYGIEDGLPKLRVQALAEGADGSIWAATNGGLVRLDPAASAERPAFRPAGPAEASGRIVEWVFVDRAGAVWFGSGGELYRLGPGGVSAAGLASVVADGAVVRAMREAGDGTLWLGTSRGLVRLPRGGRPVRIPLGEGSGPDDVRGLLLDGAGRLWATTPGAVFVFRPPPSGGGLLPVHALLAPDGRVRLPSRDGEIAALRGVPGAPQAVWQKPIETRDGRLLFSTTSGLFVLDGERVETFGRHHGLGDGLLGELLEDGDGNVWIGTQSTGLLRLSPAGFTSFGEPGGLSDPRIASLVPGPERGVLAASPGNASLFLFAGEGLRAVRFRPEAPASSRLLWGRSVLRDRTGEWWIGTPSGLARFAPVPFDALARTPPRGVYTVREGLGGNDVSALYEDADGSLWAGVFDSASTPLSRFDRAAGRFQSFGTSDGLPGTPPLAFLANGGDLWIAFGAGGVVLRRGGRFRRLGAADGIPEGFAHDLLLDRAGALWIADGGAGALRIAAPASESPAAVAVPTTEGPAVASVYALAEDPGGRLYFGTSRGVGRLDPGTGRIRRFTTADGLVNNVVTSALADPSGALWFGTPEGISRLRPTPDSGASAPRAVITSVRVNGNAKPVPELGARTLPALALAADETRMRVDFAAPSFAPGERVRFQTRLQGVDAAWTPPGAEPTVRYVGLAPGRYRFAVRVVGPSGEPGDEAAFSFAVAPPLWRRAPFLLAVAATLALAAFLVHRQSVRRAVAVERVRTRLASDLHDDVGSSLARISILSEVGHRHLQGQGDAARVFDEIGETSRAVIDALGDAIWSIDPRRDDLQSLADRLRHFAADLLEGRGIAFRLGVPAGAPGVELPPELRRHLFLFVKEAVTNAARHSGATEVEVAFRLAGRELSVEVNDDGAGFVPAAAGIEGRGLSNMELRAGSLGARLDVAAALGRGTRIRLEGVPLPRAVMVPLA